MAGLSVREAKSSCRSHGVNCTDHTQRPEGRERVSARAKGQVRDGKGSAFRRDSRRCSLEEKLARREKDLFSAYNLISRLKAGKEMDASPW